MRGKIRIYYYPLCHMRNCDESSQDRNYWRALVNEALNLGVL